MRRRLSLLLSVTLSLGGCRDFGAIHDASAEAVRATRGWDDVAGELAGSCLRDSRFNPAIADCQSSAKAAAGTIAVDRLLAAYFGAIADVSNGRNFTVEPGLNDLAASAGAIPGADQGRISAAFGLATALSNLITGAARERAMRRLIAEGGPHAIVLIDFLEQYVVPALRTKIGSERDDMAVAFAGYIAAQGGQFPNPPEALCAAPGPRVAQFGGAKGGVNFLLAVDYCRRVAMLQREDKAIAHYTASLGAARALVTDLAGAKFKLKDRVLIETIARTAAELSEKSEAVRDAFARGKSE